MSHTDSYCHEMFPVTRGKVSSLTRGMTNSARVCRTGVKGVYMTDETNTNLGGAECGNSSSASDALQRCLVMAENTSAGYSLV